MQVFNLPANSVFWLCFLFVGRLYILSIIATQKFFLACLWTRFFVRILSLVAILFQEPQDKLPQSSVWDQFDLCADINVLGLVRYGV